MMTDGGYVGSDQVLRRKELVRLIQSVPGFGQPLLSLEQYATPPDLAASLIWHAWETGDITDKRVVDLCAGTGRLGIAALAMGASEVLFVDIDSVCLQQLYDFLKNSLDLESNAALLVRADVRQDALNAHMMDVAILNPPFGVQGRVADRVFIDRALSLCETVYAIMAATAGVQRIVTDLASKHRRSVSIEARGLIEIPPQFVFHKRGRHSTEINVVRFGSEDC